MATGIVERTWLSTERWALLKLHRLTRRIRPSSLPRHLRIGIWGEFEAMFYLRREGYQVIERRWRTPDHNGDVDLIGWDGERLCFVEVKTRTARDRTPAALAVDAEKERMLRRMGRSFLRTMARDERERIVPRFDVVSVYLLGKSVECEIMRDAFPWRETDSARYGV